MDPEHGFAVEITWTGAREGGTTGYRDYGRDHDVRAEGKQHAIAGSAARPFRGEADRWNPEEMLVAALAQCHLLSYLHVATTEGLVVVAYRDAASGTLRTEGLGGRMVEAVLHPVVTLAAHHDEADARRAMAAHARASELCFIANSVSFPVRHEPRILIAEA